MIPASSPRSPTPKLADLKVLIVEDSAQMASLLRRFLAHMGVRNIVCVEDSQTGLTEVERFRPDLVLTDWMIAPFDGCEFVRRLRRLPDDGLAETPVVMLSGHGEEHRVKEARDAGINTLSRQAGFRSCRDEPGVVGAERHAPLHSAPELYRTRSTRAHPGFRRRGTPFPARRGDQRRAAAGGAKTGRQAASELCEMNCQRTRIAASASASRR
jgi:CheY-like chemotaxis protein